MKINCQIQFISVFIIAIFTLVVFVPDKAYGQLVAISLEQRIDNSSIIFEGKVISKSSFWNESHTHIYTSNITSVYKVFKGTLSTSKVEIITQGGIVGNNMEQVSNTLELSEGDVGIFTAIPNTVKLSSNSNLMKLKTYSGIQGFIKYDLNSGTAKDPFRTYKNIKAEVYPQITNRTKSDFKIIRQADFLIK